MKSLELLDLASRSGVIVPSLWSFELANSLLSAQRQKRITAEESRQALGRIRLLLVDVESRSPVSIMEEWIELAGKYHLTVYDAAYLHLAIQANTALATFDTDLAKAARKAGVSLL